MILRKRHKELIKSYARSVLAALLAVVATVDFTWQDLLKAFAAAVIPPIIRWLDPKDKAFGRTH